MKIDLKPVAALSPVPIVLVTSGNEEKTNIITIAWTGIISSEPPYVYVSIRPARHSYNLIKETKEFVINLPSEELLNAVDYAGIKSGKDVDKFSELKLTKEPSKMIITPGIKECKINLECRLKEIQDMGAHHMFVGEIVNVNCEKDYMNDNGTINYQTASLITYLRWRVLFIRK